MLHAELVAKIAPQRWASLLVAAFRAARLELARTDCLTFTALIEEADTLGSVVVGSEAILAQVEQPAPAVADKAKRKVK
jgi:hypothetical protein